MSSAREEILQRIRRANALAAPVPDDSARPAAGPESARPAAVPVSARPAAGPESSPAMTAAERLDLFCENVADYRATVRRISETDVAQAVATTLDEAGATQVVVPTGLDPRWLAAAHGVAVIADSGPGLSATELDGNPAVVTASAVGIARTGTVILDHAPDQGRRAISLVPDLHVCVIRADQVVDDVPEAVALVDPTRPLTWISGPSATSDIELNRVEGVHGPRTLVVLVVEPLN